jgi:spermidine synthase
VPLFWVVPLALYLLSFVLAFGGGRRISPQQAAPTVRVLVLAVAIVYFAGVGSAWWLSGLASLGCLFAVALLCHGRLSDLRPDARRLSTFYLCLALGGALGGLFNALIAPRIFPGLAEYPLGVLLAAFLLPPIAARSRRERLLDLEIGFAVFALVVIAVFVTKRVLDPGPPAMVAIFLIPSLIALRAARSPLRFGACVAGIIIGAALMLPQGIGRVLYQERTFFGVLRVALQRSTYHALLHGSTTHGQQNMRDGERGTPLGYYHRASPIGQVLEATARARPAMSVGVVGLGAGTLAAYSRERDSYRFFEIDPGVERIARDPSMFTYLADASGRVSVILGDARVSIERDDTRFDVLVLDAFSSDAIPVHLLTREAFALYERRLNAGGLIAVHVSNRYLDMRPALAGLAGEAGLDLLVQDQPISEEAARRGYASSRWVLLRRHDDPNPVWDAMSMGEWHAYRGTPSSRPWSDDYSNLVQAVLTGFKEL